ncbi:hypothetical protein OH492_28625 [Vibrio chagasii]|nr:hypothetical protein [Vibrio chagasii]
MPGKESHSQPVVHQASRSHARFDGRRQIAWTTPCGFGNHIDANISGASTTMSLKRNVTTRSHNAMKLNVGEQNLPMNFSLLSKQQAGAVLSVLKRKRR